MAKEISELDESAARSSPPRLVSVVAPVYNEVGLIERVLPAHDRRARRHAFELVLVDDGSTDGTSAVLESLAAADARVRLIPLSRNFGHQVALTAGLDHARGNPVVMLDADLQDPPELIPEMLEHWRGGNDVVYAVRRQRAGETTSSAARRSCSTACSGGSPRSTSSRSRATSACSTGGRSTPCSPCASAAASCAA